MKEALSDRPEACTAIPGTIWVLGYLALLSSLPLQSRMLPTLRFLQTPRRKILNVLLALTICNGDASVGTLNVCELLLLQ